MASATAAPVAKNVSTTFIVERETKNTKRFAEEGPEDNHVLGGTIYVPKDTLARLGDPDRIIVVVEAA